MKKKKTLKIGEYEFPAPSVRSLSETTVTSEEMRELEEVWGKLEAEARPAGYEGRLKFRGFLGQREASGENGRFEMKHIVELVHVSMGIAQTLVVTQEIMGRLCARLGYTSLEQAMKAIGFAGKNINIDHEDERVLNVLSMAFQENTSLNPAFRIGEKPDGETDVH